MIENFLFNLKMTYYELDSRFADLKDKKITKKQRIEALVTNSLLPVTKQEICDGCPTSALQQSNRNLESR